MKIKSPLTTKVKVKLTDAEKADLANLKAYRKRLKEDKAYIRELNKLIRNESKILKFMLKYDVLYYHHGRADSMKESIEKQIRILKNTNKHTEYNSYVWNHYGDGKSYMQLSLMGNLWRYDQFKSINDVPLTGEYRFYIYDSGHRGCGSFNYITACLINELPSIPEVNPGAFIPITV